MLKDQLIFSSAKNKVQKYILIIKKVGSL